MNQPAWRRLRRWATARLAAPAAALVILAVPAAAQQVRQPLRETVITVEGMVCGSCTAAVEQALKRLDGIAAAKADLKADLVRVRYDGEKVTPRQMAEAIRKGGYRARWP